MQLGRSFFMIWALTIANHEGRTNFQRVTVWLLLSGVLWMASGPGRVQRGDAVAVVMNDYDAAV